MTPQQELAELEELERLEAQKTASVGTEIPPVPVAATGLAKAGGQGLLEGVYDTLGMPGDLTNSFRLRENKSGIYWPGREDVRNLLRQGYNYDAGVLGFPDAQLPDYQPQNQAERYAMAGGRGVTQTLIPGAGIPMKVQAGFGALTGLATEAGRQAFGDEKSGEKTGEVVGSAAPGILSMLLKAGRGLNLIPPLLTQVLPPALEDLAKSVPYKTIAKALLTSNAANPPIRPLPE